MLARRRALTGALNEADRSATPPPAYNSLPSSPPSYADEQWFFDGIRMLRFVEASRVAKPSALHIALARFEDLCGQKLDWTPLGLITYTCKAGNTRIYWKHEGLGFHADLPTDLAEAYMIKHCTPVSPEFSPESAPEYLHSASSSTRTSVSYRSAPDELTRPELNIGDSDRQTNEDINGEQSAPSQLHWLVKKPPRNPQQTILCILDCLTIKDDRKLCQELTESRKRVHGFLGKWISCKHLTGVEFVKFSRVFDNSDQVVATNRGLPSGGSYDFIMADTEESHMILTSTQLTACILNPRRASAYNVLLSSLPKKVDGPLSKTWADPGYGIQEVKSWSPFRIIRLLIIFDSAGFLFLGLWLGLE